jgi:hypothetical protein
MFFSELPPFLSDDVFMLMFALYYSSFVGGFVLRVCGSTVDVTLRHVLRWGEDTSNICCYYILCSTFSMLTSPHHTKRNALKKEYLDVMIKKGYKG